MTMLIENAEYKALKAAAETLALIKDDMEKSVTMSLTPQTTVLNWRNAACRALKNLEEALT